MANNLEDFVYLGLFPAMFNYQDTGQCLPSIYAERPRRTLEVYGVLGPTLFHYFLGLSMQGPPGGPAAMSTLVEAAPLSDFYVPVIQKYRSLSAECSSVLLSKGLGLHKVRRPWF